MRGKARKVWKIRASERDNHLLDCRIYNLALAEFLGLSSITPEEWAGLAKRRGMPSGEANLFRPQPLPVAAVIPAPPPDPWASALSTSSAPQPAPPKEDFDAMLDRLGRANADLWT